VISGFLDTVLDTCLQIIEIALDFLDCNAAVVVAKELVGCVLALALATDLCLPRRQRLSRVAMLTTL
jgi:hypothetical protein